MKISEIPYQESIERVYMYILFFLSIHSDAYPLSLSTQATHGSQLRLFLQLLHPWTGIYTTIVNLQCVCVALLTPPSTYNVYLWLCV